MQLNRTNSVEPSYSQPLQMTYHQLLMGKSRLEDELYQSQRQLRRKEGEYQKKIAVYEQEIGYLKQSLGECKEKEKGTKAMYEKILECLNIQDQHTFKMDMERIQKLIRELTHEYQLNIRVAPQSLFPQAEDYSKAEEDKQKTLLLATQNAEEKEKLQKDLAQKEAEILQQQETMKQIQQEYQSEMETMKETYKAERAEKDLIIEEMKKKHAKEVLEFKEQTQRELIILEEKKKEMEEIKDKYSAEQKIVIEKVHNKENGELHSKLEKIQKERDQEQQELLQKQAELEDKLVQLEMLNKGINKKMNGNISNNKEVTQRLRQKLSEQDKESNLKNDEIAKLKNKLQQQKGVIQKLELEKNQLIQKEQDKKVAISNMGMREMSSRQVGFGFTSPLDFSTIDFPKKSKPVTKTKIQQNQARIPQKTGGNNSKPAVQDQGLDKTNSRNQTNTSNINNMGEEENDRSPNFISMAQTPIAKANLQFQEVLSEQDQNILDQIGHHEVNSDEKRKTNEVSHKYRQQPYFLGEQRSKEQDNGMFQSQSPLMKKKFGIREQKQDGVAANSLEIEELVRNIIDKVNREKQSPTHGGKEPKQYCAHMRPPPPKADKDVLTLLEGQLQELALKSKKIKEIVTERDSWEQKYRHLKEKYQLIKAEHSNLVKDREGLLTTNQKIELRLRQAQVILNENDLKCSILQTNDASFLDGKTQLSLNIENTNQCRQVQPMTCRVQDSYQGTLRLNQTSNLTQSSSQKRENMQSQNERSFLDSSVATLKKEKSLCNQFLPINQQSTTTLQMNSARGKTPTLHINLTEKQRIAAIDDDEGVTVSASSAVTSRNFNKSQTNLLLKKAWQYKGGSSIPTSKKGQIQRYASNRDISAFQMTMFRSPQTNQNFKKMPTNAYNTQNNNLEEGNVNQSNLNGIGGANKSNMKAREKSPLLNQTAKQNSVSGILNNKLSIFKQVNQKKGKDRYYSRRQWEPQHITYAFEDEEEDPQKINENLAKQFTLNQAKIQAEKQPFESEEDGHDELDELKTSHMAKFHVNMEKIFEDEDSGSKLKKVNNSNFIPSLYSRQLPEEFAI